MTERHHGARYVLTGPEINTPAALVTLIGEALGRDLRWVESSIEDERERLLRWMPPAFVDTALRARTAPPIRTTTVETVLGRPARTYRDWLTDHAADFRRAGAS